MTYLDTHVVIWLYEGKVSQLGRDAARLITQSESLLISPTVELELAYLYNRGIVTVRAADIIADLRARIGLTTCDLPFPLVVHEAASISWTRDVFDRLIVAQASATNSALISSDSMVQRHYPHVVW